VPSSGLSLQSLRWSEEGASQAPPARTSIAGYCDTKCDIHIPVTFFYPGCTKKPRCRHFRSTTLSAHQDIRPASPGHRTEDLGIDDLIKDSPSNPGLQSIDDDEIRLSSQEILKVELEIHQVIKGLLPIPKLHQDIDITRLGGLAPHQRTKYADAGHAVAFPDGAKVLPDLGKRMH